MSVHDFLPLEGSPLKPASPEDGNGQDMVVMDWDTDKQQRIPLTIDATTLDIMNLAKADRAIGPMAFREVPGAVLPREFPTRDHTPRLTAPR